MNEKNILLYNICGRRLSLKQKKSMVWRKLKSGYDKKKEIIIKQKKSLKIKVLFRAKMAEVLCF